MKMSQGPVGDLLVHAVVCRRGGNNCRVDKLDGGELVRMIDGAVVQ